MKHSSGQSDADEGSVPGLAWPGLDLSGSLTGQMAGVDSPPTARSLGPAGGR